MARYIWNGAEFVDRTTREPMHKPYEGEITLPYMHGDIPAYASPITGEMIDGRSARREDLKKHGCVDAGDMPVRNRGLVKSEKFARKHGLKWAGDH